MTLKFNDVYINETATITGPYESKGPLGKYFDLCHKDLYFNEKNWEEAEEKLINESISMLIKKNNVNLKDVDIFIGGDLLNQIAPSNYAMKRFDKSFIGIYAACSTSTLGLILSGIFIDGGFANKVITFTSSHNMSAEKQYRYPTEYGGPKRKTTTFTSTGAASALVSKEKSNIRLESGTIGTVIDSLNKGTEAFNFMYDKLKKKLFPLGFISKLFRNLKVRFTKKSYYSDEEWKDINLLLKTTKELLEIRDTPVIDNNNKKRSN